MGERLKISHLFVLLQAFLPKHPFSMIDPIFSTWHAFIIILILLLIKSDKNINPDIINIFIYKKLHILNRIHLYQ